MKTKPHFYSTGKVKIGIHYEPGYFERRDSSGNYCAKMPEQTADGLRLQKALLGVDSGLISPRVIAVYAVSLAITGGLIFVTMWDLVP